MYTCLFNAHSVGTSCFDPLFFHFPTDDNTFIDIESSFIAADTYKVDPVMEPNVTTYEAYFPNGNWVSMKNYSDVISVNETSGGKNITHTAPNDTVNVFLMPGKIGIFQDNRDQSKKLTKDMVEDKRIQLIVNRD